MSEWKDLGNVSPVDEYVWRDQSQNYSNFLARLKGEYPNE